MKNTEDYIKIDDADLEKATGGTAEELPSEMYGVKVVKYEDRYKCPMCYYEHDELDFSGGAEYISEYDRYRRKVICWGCNQAYYYFD